MYTSTYYLPQLCKAASELLELTKMCLEMDLGDGQMQCLITGLVNNSRWSLWHPIPSCPLHFSRCESL